MGSCRDITSRTVRETRRVQLEKQYNETWIHTTPVSSYCSPAHWPTSHSSHAFGLDWSSGYHVCVCMCVLSKAVVVEE